MISSKATFPWPIGKCAELAWQLLGSGLGEFGEGVPYFASVPTLALIEAPSSSSPSSPSFWIWSSAPAAKFRVTNGQKSLSIHWQDQALKNRFLITIFTNNTCLTLFVWIYQFTMLFVWKVKKLWFSLKRTKNHSVECLEINPFLSSILNWYL